MDAEQVLAFRFARSGLTDRSTRDLFSAPACPASDFSPGAALLALAARAEDVTREGYDSLVDDGEIVVAHVIRGAIHAVAPGDHALYGRALVARDDAELAAQMGEQVKRLAAEHGFATTEALDEVTGAIDDALKGGQALDKVALHQAMRERVREELLPWCKGCGSHHVAPMMWRFATVKAGARLDSKRRYVAGKPGRPPAAREAVRRFLHFYGPSTPAAFADWAGLAEPHAKRLWDDVAGDLADVDGHGALLREDVADLASPPEARGVRFLPPGDPYLQKANRPLLAPDPDLRKQLFRPVASPGAVVEDGRLVGLWRAKAKGKRSEVTVDKLARFERADVEDEAQRVARLRGAAEAVLVVR